MGRKTTKLAPPQGLGANQTATFNIPIGPVYHGFHFELLKANGTAFTSAEIIANVKEVRVEVGGDATIRLSGQHLVMLNKYYGMDGVAGVLPLMFSRKYLREAGGEDLTSYATYGISTLHVHIEFGATAPAKLIGHALTTPGHFVDSGGQLQRILFGPHLQIKVHKHQQALTGDASISDLPTGGHSVFAFHINTTSIDDIEVVGDGNKLFETNQTMRKQIAQDAEFTQQAGYTDIQFMTERRIGNAQTMNWTDFRLEAQFTGTGNFDIVSEYLDRP